MVVQVIVFTVAAARAVRAAQQRPDRAALGAGARAERRGGRRSAARRRAGLSLRHLEGADGLRLARRARSRFRSSRSRSSTSRPRRRSSSATRGCTPCRSSRRRRCSCSAAATSLYLVGVESMRDARAVGRRASRRLLRLVRRWRWRSTSLAIVEGVYRYRFNHDANERRRIRMAVYTAVPGVFAYAVKDGVPIVGDAAGRDGSRRIRGRSPRSCSCSCCCRRSG